MKGVLRGSLSTAYPYPGTSGPFKCHPVHPGPGTRILGSTPGTRGPRGIGIPTILPKAPKTLAIENIQFLRAQERLSTNCITKAAFWGCALVGIT
eukprot:2427681-Rhodomonas_salina.1